MEVDGEQEENGDSTTIVRATERTGAERALQRPQRAGSDLEEDPCIYIDSSSPRNERRQPPPRLRIRAPPLRAAKKEGREEEPEEAVRQRSRMPAEDVRREAERLFRAFMRSQHPTESAKWTPFTQPTQPQAVDYRTLLKRNSAMHNYSGAMNRKAPCLRAASDSEDEPQEVAMSAIAASEPSVMAATAQTHGYSMREGKWHPPKDLPPLSEETPDIDWWFHQMQLHLDRCRIFHQYERVDLLHTHTDNDFLARIRDRAETEGITAEQLRSSPDAYRVYVAARFVSHVALPRLRREIDRLYGKCLEPREAWKRVRKLSYCYNEKAKRMAMDQISHLDISRIFIAALKPKMRDFLTSKLCDDHPMCTNSSYALSAAIQYQEEVKAMKPHGASPQASGSESEGSTEKDGALIATQKKGKKRGKRATRSERRKRKKNAEKEEQAAGSDEDGKKKKT